MEFVDTNNQVADIFTKPLDSTKFEYFRSCLNLLEIKFLVNPMHNTEFEYFCPGYFETSVSYFETFNPRIVYFKTWSFPFQKLSYFISKQGFQKVMF